MSTSIYRERRAGRQAASEACMLFYQNLRHAENMGRKWVSLRKAPAHVAMEDAAQVAAEALWTAACRYRKERCDVPARAEDYSEV